jgi:hypothetical protein
MVLVIPMTQWWVIPFLHFFGSGILVSRGDQVVEGHLPPDDFAPTITVGEEGSHEIQVLLSGQSIQGLRIAGMLS